MTNSATLESPVWNIPKKFHSPEVKLLHLTEPISYIWEFRIQVWNCKTQMGLEHTVFFFFLFNLLFLLKDNCFKEFCYFLSNLNMNQPYVYIYPLLYEPLAHLPSHPTPLGLYRAPVWVSWAIQQIPMAIYFTYGNVSFHVTLSIHLTLSSPLPCP